MVWSATPADLIVETIAHHPDCCLDDLVTFCPELTWNQIFFEVDRLSRSGFLKLALVEPGRYTVVVPALRENSAHLSQRIFRSIRRSRHDRDRILNACVAAA